MARQSFAVPIPDALCDWIAANSVAEKKSFGYSQIVVEAFDFDALMDHYDITGDSDGSWFLTDVCPVAGRKHEQSTCIGFYYDGEHLGFKCFAASCPGSDMSVGDVIAHLNKAHTP